MNVRCLFVLAGSVNAPLFKTQWANKNLETEEARSPKDEASLSDKIGGLASLNTAEVRFVLLSATNYNFILSTLLCVLRRDCIEELR